MPRYLHPYLDAARAWWSSLSINQMKEMAKKHNGCLSYLHVTKVDHRLVDTYTAELGLEVKQGTYY
jgi:hypothetical protein